MYNTQRSRLIYQTRHLAPAPVPHHRQRSRRGTLQPGLRMEFALRLALAGVFVVLLHHVVSQSFKAALNALPFP